MTDSIRGVMGDGVTFILQPVKLPREYLYELLRMTPARMNYAFRTGGWDDRGQATDLLGPLCQAANRVLTAETTLEAEAADFRRLLIETMASKYPAAARHMLAGQSPRRRRSGIISKE